MGERKRGVDERGGVRTLRRFLRPCVFSGELCARRARGDSRPPPFSVKPPPLPIIIIISSSSSIIVISIIIVVIIIVITIITTIIIIDHSPEAHRPERMRQVHAVEDHREGRGADGTEPAACLTQVFFNSDKSFGKLW